MIFDEEGKLISGWVTAEEIKDVRGRLATELRRQGVRLCNPVGQHDLTEDILDVLYRASYLTDILVKADDEGHYQAILLGGKEDIMDDTLGPHTTFHVIYLCSIAKGAGAELINKVKSNLNEHAQSITLEPLEDIKEKGYYYKFGFEHIPNKSPTMIWYPGIKGGRRRRRRTVRRRRQTHKLKFR